jgi:hypothetical protein
MNKSEEFPSARRVPRPDGLKPAELGNLAGTNVQFTNK